LVPLPPSRSRRVHSCQRCLWLAFLVSLPLPHSHIWPHFDRASEYRFALPALATDLVNRKVDVLVAMANSAALAAKAVTTTIPVVFAIGGDRVKLGLVESHNRPGGNITGVSFFLTQLESKRLGLLHELVLHATEIAVLINPTEPTASDQVNEVKEATRALGLDIHIVHAAASLCDVRHYPPPVDCSRERKFHKVFPPNGTFLRP